MAVALVVEDEWLVRMEMSEALQDSGWEVIEASSGETGLLVLQQNRRIDLLITDIRLPGAVTGWDLAEAFRAACDGIGVIYCSGNPADLARQVRDSVFLSKPCRSEFLVATAAKLCVGVVAPRTARK